jgi:hypothetical protein
MMRKARLRSWHAVMMAAALALNRSPSMAL